MVCSCHQISINLATPETDHVTQLHQQSAGQVTMAWVSWVGMLSEWKGPEQAAEPVTGLSAQRSVMMAAAEAVCRRPSNCYSWQCLSHGHLPHMSPHRYTDSPLPCTETSSPPA